MAMFFILYISLCSFLSVNGLCYFPCSRQQRQRYVAIVNGTTVHAQFSCEHPTIALSDGERIECYGRAGAFLIQRREGNRFRCLKQMAVDPIDGFISVSYGLPWTFFPNNPTFCEVCSVPGDWTVQFFVAEEIADKYFSRYRRSTKEKIPPLGCNVPKECPVNNPNTDVPCTGCEPLEDDGLCCEACQQIRHVTYQENES